KDSSIPYFQLPTFYFLRNITTHSTLSPSGYCRSSVQYPAFHSSLSATSLWGRRNKGAVFCFPADRRGLSHPARPAGVGAAPDRKQELQNHFLHRAQIQDTSHRVWKYSPRHSWRPTCHWYPKLHA